MKVGFYIPFDNCDASYVALPVIAEARKSGLSVSVVPSRKTNNCIKDFLPLVNKYVPNYIDWISRGISYVVFTEPVPSFFVESAKKLNIKTILIFVWTSFRNNNMPDISAYDYVIFPSDFYKNELCRLNDNGNFVTIPWDFSVPIIKPDLNKKYNTINLCWVINGDQGKNQSIGFLSVISYVLNNFDKVIFNIIIGNKLDLKSLDRIKKLKYNFIDRLNLYYEEDLDKQNILIAKNDLMLWPSLLENFGMPGLCSMFSGTPVIAFNIPVISDFVINNVNGVLVDFSDRKFLWGDIFEAVPDYDKFKEELGFLLNDKKRLNKLNKNIIKNFSDRILNFSVCWWSIFSS